MRAFTIGLFIVVLSSTCPFADARLQQGKNHRFVVEPSESALLVVASQPDCPLTIMNAKRFLNINQVSDVRYEYQVHNRGAKAVADFTLVAWNSFGNGGTLIPKWKFTKELLAPSQTIGSEAMGREDEVVPLTDELRDQLKLRGPMKAIIVLMVEKVVFSDGSVYNDEATSKSLLRYFEALNLRPNAKNSNPN